MRRLVLIAIVGWLTGAACTQPRSPRCREVCTRQLECRELGAKDIDTSFDEKECVAQCSALETDPETRPLVEARAACLRQPEACERCK
jgi:hypothetical protein